jgi:RHS repeat-associated protein
LISTTDPLGNVETYEYDGNDNLTKRITPKADTISFAYDAVNQLLSKTLPGNLVTSYAYDAVGNLTSVTDPDSTLTMTYDQANRLLTTSTAGSANQPSVTLTYAYDKNGNRLTAADPSGTNTYTYDALNRLASLASPAGLATYVYDALSRRTSMTLSNGTQTTYQYDPASQVTAISHQLSATSQLINQAGYTYNGVGNRTSLTDRRGIQNFGYDQLDRLTSASHPLLATPQTFAYDPVGNRTTDGSVHNAGNQLTADATHAYQYDDNGNLTRKTLLATGNYSQYTYDAENRLVKVEDFAAGNPTPAAISTYQYDGLGRRIEKVANGQTRRYVYDGDDILLEYDGTNTLQARFTHGPGIDEPIAVTKAGSTFFYHQDGLGTVTELTDATGATAKSYAYDAYGNILESPGTLEQPYTYTGREFDAEGGQYHYRVRNYDSRLGRFLEEDPIGLRGGINLFGYVRNNPVRYNDPFGLCACPGGVWDQEFGDSQVSIAFGGYFSIGKVNYTCRSKPSLKCRGRQTCFGGGPIVGAGLSGNISGAARGAADSVQLGGWSSLSLAVAAGPIGVQAPLPPDAGGNVSGGPGVGGGAALIRCYTDYLKCNCSCNEND